MTKCKCIMSDIIIKGRLHLLCFECDSAHLIEEQEKKKDKSVAGRRSCEEDCSY